jgi:tryptophan synthase alpha chain
MSRIAEVFETLRRDGRKGLIGFLTAGDPTPEQSLDDVRTALACGVDLLELGVPFSDPTADGPVIQAAGQRALASGMTVGKALLQARAIRSASNAPILLFGYANPFFRYGLERLCEEAAGAGVDGLLVVDLPFEESAELRGLTARAGLDLIPLISPTTPLERARHLLADATGFVYYVLVKGVTGARRAIPADVARSLAGLRTCTGLPIAAGFGVSDPQQVREVAGVADAVVVGSALVTAAREHRLDPFVRSLRRAIP